MLRFIEGGLEFEEILYIFILVYGPYDNYIEKTLVS